MGGVTLSVVIPTHDHGRYLAQAIRSVRTQDAGDLQIVVVDDGSSDATAEVLAGLAGPDLEVIRQPRRGPAAARNRGIRASGGEWLAFLDADSYWLPGKLDAQLRAISAAPGEVAMAYTGSVVVDDSGVVRVTQPVPADPYTAVELMWGNLVHTSSVVARRNALIEAGMFDERLPGLSEDWDMWLRLLAAGAAACVPEPLVARRASRFASKYRVRDLEAATEAVFERFAASAARNGLEVHRHVGRARSWHRSVLAKSYARHRQIPAALRCAARSIAAHPVGLRYLARRAAPTDGTRLAAAAARGAWT